MVCGRSSPRGDPASTFVPECRAGIMARSATGGHPLSPSSHCDGGSTHGGHEAADRRRSARGHQGGTRHRDARPAGGWRAARRRAVGRRGQCSRRRPEERRGLTSALDSRKPRSASRTAPAGASSGLLPDVRLGEGSAIDAADVDAIAVPTTAGEQGADPGADIEQLSARLGIDLGAHLVREKAKGQPGELIALPLAQEQPRLVLFVGIGTASVEDMRTAGAALGRRCRDVTSVATTACINAEPAALRAFIEGLLLSTYSFSVKSDPKPIVLERVDVDYRDGGADALDRARATARAA